MLERLQKVQNPATRLFFNVANKMTFHLFKISQHCLPIKAHIDYKPLIICHSFVLKLDSYLLVWSTLNLHTQKKSKLFLSQQNSLYP